MIERRIDRYALFFKRADGNRKPALGAERRKRRGTRLLRLEQRKKRRIGLGAERDRDVLCVGDDPFQEPHDLFAGAVEVVDVNEGIGKSRVRQHGERFGQKVLRGEIAGR